MSKFVHLHVHDEFSINDASCKIDKLMKKVKDLGMTAIAETNHGNLFGMIKFYKEAKKQGIKPIIGAEAYICPEGKEARVRDNRHIVLLAKNNTGLSNLIKIMSDAAINGYYYNARTDYETLKKYSEGLICLTGCLAGDIPREISNEGYEAGRKKLDMYIDIFGKDNLYIEVQDNNIEDQYKMNELLFRLSKETGVPLVATNDIHYIEKKDAFFHDVLMALQGGTTIYDKEKRKVYGSQDFYVKSYDEMNTGRLPKEALENTVKIAERCNVEIEFGKYHIPKFNVPAPFKDSKTFLRHLAYKGLRERYPDYNERKTELEERLEYELSVIEDMGFVDYFLIVWDFVRYAYEIGALDGPGRGSAAGSLLSYTLRITDIEPLRFGLIFERFLNPSRVSMPDIDWDIQDDMRHLLIEYVIDLYGAENVCQIITFGTYGAKGAVRAAGRALGIEYSVADKVAKAVPEELGISIEEALSKNPDLRAMYENEKTIVTHNGKKIEVTIKEFIDAAIAIEGLPSHTSTHAAGVLISPQPVDELVPLWSNDGTVVAQFDMGTLEEIGMLKMDFLGLKTLSVIADTIKWVKVNRGIEITRDDLLNMIDDPNSYVLIKKKLTQGIFQLESTGMTMTAGELQPNNIEELTALISLYRPGPMDYIPKYIANKRNPENIELEFECLKEILKETYGVLTYQEQVMFASQIMSGYKMSDADSLRKAIGKKKEDLIQKHREYYIYGQEDEETKEILIPGAIRNGHDESKLIKFYDETIVPFGRYAFNKSHGVSYAFLAAQTSNLKFNFPVEFMASLLTHEEKLSKIALYVNHCTRDLNIEVVPPDINISTEKFVPTTDGKIIFSLAAIKDVGVSSSKDIAEERMRGGKFESLTDFIERRPNSVNRTTVESLIKAGAFDSLGKTRSQLIAIMDSKLEESNKRRKKLREGQRTIFPNPYPKDDIVPRIKEYPNRIFLNLEKEKLGLYVSGHPLQSVKGYASKYSNVCASDFVVEEDLEGEKSLQERCKFYEGQKVSIVCLLTEVKKHYTKNDNKPMAFLTAEDTTGNVSITVFNWLYENVKEYLVEDKIVHIQGKINFYNGEVSIIAEDLKVIENKKYTTVRINTKTGADLDIAISCIKNNSGDYPVYVRKGNWEMLLSKDYWTNDQGIRELNRQGFKTIIREE